MIIKSTIQKLVILTFGVLIGFSACKKDPKPTPTPVTPPVVTPPTRAELTKDSIFLYAAQTYYWNEPFPSYDAFKPRSYASNQAVLDAIIKLPGTGKPVDKYSFLDDGSVSSELGGVSGDYGFSVFYNGTTPTSDLRIKYVSPNSPAAGKGLKRGYRITKINGRTELSTGADANVAFVSDAVFGSANTVSLTVQKPNGTTEDVVVNRGTYATTPIFHTSVLTAGSKKVGYIVFNSFTTNSRDALTAKMAEFTAAGVTELVVDLRYNGGGSVATADVFTNLIAPASLNGTTMYTTFWTKTMQDGKASILSNQPLTDGNGKLQPFTGGVNGVYATYADIDYKPAANREVFAKVGSANISKVYFLVLSGTASASELLINNLKPHMDVKLIGRTTYGKPVGFFAIGIDKLDLYIPQFETKNSQNVGGYYTGMTPDFTVADDVTKDFGDKTESLLAAALSYSEKGTFSLIKPNTTISSVKPMSVKEAEVMTDKLDGNRFRGMSYDKKLKLKQK
ncbi:S41 family peptidase [Daejeonella lutea]|uniref:Peptidase family S41 n=1 Tax=Daejeonella lutea TaxID=572036 RepID=A0A1T5AG07_9SPHI|nr:S41 family peptidase [Daejeonella lutea]SKB33573.1 Peptidase family S41 [Daejeonella lutea]